jgi:uncharacterized protein (TIGR02145 family)
MSRNNSFFLFMKHNLITKLLVLIACACFIGNGWGQTLIGASPYTVPATGTYTIPAGVTSITVQCWGGGGGGGGAKYNFFTASFDAGGGGGGGYATATFTVNPGDVISVSVGASGTAGTTGGGSGGAGGTSSVTYTVVKAAATGGAGGIGVIQNSSGIQGAGGNGGTATTGTGFTGGKGGAGFPGSSFDVGGGGGGGAGSSANGSIGTTSSANGSGGAPGGAGGASSGGNGGAGGKSSGGAVAGSNGSTFGGGGGGAAGYSSGSKAGGAGAVGQVIITYTAAPTCTAPTSVALSGFTTPICSGSNPGTFTATATGGSPTTYTYLWYKDGVSTGTTTQTYAPGNLTANTNIYCVVSTGSGCSTTSPTTTITVVSLAAPVISNSLVCSGALVTWPAVSSADGYEIQVATNSTFSAFLAGNNCAGVGCSGGINLGNVTSASITNLTPGSTYYIRVRARCNGTTFGWSNTLIVVASSSTSSTAPTSVSGTTSVCSGSSTTLTTSGGSLGTNADDIWYSGSCPTECYKQEWLSQPFGLTTTNQNSLLNGTLTVTSTSVDPNIDMGGLGSFNPATCRYINIRYRVTAGTAGNVELFFYNTLHNYAVGGETGFGTLISDNAWHIVSVDMWQDLDYLTGGNILGWRFDWATADAVTMDIDFITLTSSPAIGTGTSITVSPTSTTSYYTLKQGDCNTTTCASATVTVVQSPTTSAPGSNQTICQGTSATLAANIPSVGTGAWSVTSGPNTSSTQFSNTASNASTFTPTAAGTYVLTWTISNSPCAASANTVTITSIGTTTTATVSSATLSVCGSLTSGVLGGNTPSNGTGTWSIVSGGSGSFSSVNSGSSTFTAGAYGTYVLRWTITNSPCASSTADVTVTFTPSIDFANTNFPSSATICTGGSQTIYGKIYINGVTVNAGATSGLVAELGYSSSNSNPSGAGWTWVTASFNTQVSNDDEYVATLTGLAAGTYYYAYRYSYNGCAYTYGGTGGIWSSNSGVLTVNDCFGTYASAPNLTSCNTTVSSQGPFYNTTGSGANLINSSGTIFTGYDFGSYYVNSGGLLLKGAEIKTWKAATANVCSGKMYYRVYTTGSPSGAFTLVNLPYYDGCSSGTFPTGGPCNTGDQKWRDISQSINLTNYAAGNYTLEVYYEITGSHLSTSTCETTLTLNNSGANYTSTFTLLAIPTASNTGAYCVGETIQLNAANGTSYSWSGPNSFSASTQSPTIATATTAMAGTYTVTATLGAGCSQTATTSVVINTPTTPTFTQVATICAGASLSALPTTSNNSITGTWSPALDNSQTTTYTFTPTAGLCANTTTMTITVNPAPSVVVSNNGPLCTGQTLNLTCSDSYSTYAWSGPSSFSSALQNPTIASVVAGNAGIYTLTATDANGCQGTGTTTVSLSNAPTPSSNSPVCVGGSLSLSVGSASSYSWSGPNSFSSTLQNPTVSASATSAMAGIYTISLIGSCAGTGISETFADGNYTANPVWSVTSGGWQIYNISSTQYLYGDNTATVDVITTPSTQAYGTWNFDYSLQTTASTTSQVLRFFVTASSTALTTTNGYYVFVDGGGNLFLRKLTAGTATTLISSTWTANTSWHTVKVIRDFDNTFKLYLDGVLKGTSAADNSFTTSNYMGAWNTGAFASDNHRLDNISTIPPTTATTTVVVNSTPSISNKTGTICSGNTYTMATAAPDVVPSGTTYTWTYTSNPNISGATTGTTQSSFAQTLTNTSSMPQTIVYSVTPSIGGSCAGTAFSVTIIVDAPLNGGTVSTDQTICSGGTPTLLSSTLLPSGGSGLGITGSVQIGTQIWMNSNLNVVNYNDGTPVGTVFNTTAGAYTWYQDNYPTWGQYYGALYNWYAVNTGKLCPSGWHVPTLTEYTTLINLASGSTTAGKKLKSCRTVSNGCATTIDPRWDANSSAFGTDDYGFAALPAGREYWNSGAKQFERVQTRARFWTSTLNDPSNARAIEMNYNTSDAPDAVYPYGDGYSVRCMGDNATTIQNSYTYQWQQDPGCTGAWSNISGANSLTYQPGALTQTTCFRRVTTDACGTAYSNTITITVNPGPVITAMTTTICSGTSFTATPVDGINGTVPVGTTYTWSAPVISPASSITGGSAQATAQSSISQTLTNTTTSNATATYTVTATSGSCSSTFTVTVTVLPPLVAGTVAGISSSGGGPGHLVISQIYGGGGNTSAPYTNDYVEIFNPTASSVTLTGWSVQYASAAGTTWNTASLTGSISAYSYILVQFGTNGAVGSALPTPINATSPTNMSAPNGKVALVNSTTALSGASPASSSYVDLVGFGTAGYFEGSAAAPAGTNTLAIFRASGGCTDTDVNSSNFSTGAPAPRTSASPTNPCTTVSLTETICANATASNITATAATGSTGSFTYQWYSQAGNITCPTGSSTTGWTLIPGANSLTYSPGAVTSTTTYALLITPTGAVTCGGTWATDCRKVVVNPAPIITDMTTTICSGAAFSGTPVDVTNGTVPVGTTYTWTVAANSNVTGQSAQATAQSSISQTLTNTTTTSQSVVYTVTPTFGTCVGATFTLTVTVNPKPVMTSANLAVCSPNSFSYTPTGTSIPSGTTYSWSVPSGANFTGGASGSGATTIDGVLTLSSGSTATAVYTITPSSGSCSGSTFTLTIDLSDCAPPTPFTACNLVIYRIGDGSTTLSNAAAPVSIQEVSTSGSVVQTVSSLFVGTNLLTQGGASPSSGYLNSNNGYMAVPGLNSALGTATATAENTKVTHIIDGTVTLNSRILHPTTGTMPFTSNTYRSVVPITATTFYCAGTATSTGGVWYYDGTSFTQIYNTQNNVRNLEIFNGNLYLSVGAGTARGIYQVGTGLPTTAGQTATLLFSNDQTFGSVYNFSISPDGCTAYIADDGTGATALAGITKFTKSGGVWTSSTPYASGSTRGLVVDYSATNPIIYATTAPSNGVVCNTLISITDNGASYTSNWSLSAGSNYGFDGVDFTPNSTASITVSDVTAQSFNVCQNGTSQTITATGTSSSSLTYQWYSNTVNDFCGATSIPLATSATYTPSVSSPGTTYYFLMVKGPCSNYIHSTMANVTVYANPTAAISGNLSICTGSSTTLTASGGGTYLWANGLGTNASITVSASGTYSVTVTDSNNCSSGANATVVVNQPPGINAISPP